MGDWDCDYCKYKNVCKYIYPYDKCEFGIIEKYECETLNNLRNYVKEINGLIEKIKEVDTEDVLEYEISGLNSNLEQIKDRISIELEFEYSKMKIKFENGNKK